MDINGLEKAFQNMSEDDKENEQDIQVQEDIQQPEGPYLTMDNMDRDFGDWYKHDKDIGTILMEQLNARGIDTRTATEAALREVLTDLVQRIEMLSDVFSGFKQTLNKLENDTAAVTDAIGDTMREAGDTLAPPAPDMNEMPPEAPMPTSDIAPMPMADMPPAEMPQPMDAGMSPEAGAGAPPPPDMGGMPPEGMPQPMDAGVPPQPTGTMSDERMKRIQGIISDRQAARNTVVSDARMKEPVEPAAPAGMKLDAGIIAACDKGF